jgi:hypothetical protein
MSDGKLYMTMRDNKLLVLKLKHGNDYAIDSADFTDRFAKINLKGEYYEICEVSLWKIPIVANNSRNIRRIWCKNEEYHHYCYYYVNANNELAVLMRSINLTNT